MEVNSKLMKFSCLLAHRRIVQQQEIGTNFFPCTRGLAWILQDPTVVWSVFLLTICGITQSGGGLEESFYFLVVTPTAAVKPERPAMESRPERCESEAEPRWMFSTYIQSNFISHSSASVMTHFSGFPQNPPPSLRDMDGLRSGMRALACGPLSDAWRVFLSWTLTSSL